MPQFRPVTLRTPDGVPLAGRFWPAAASMGAGDACVVAHGYTGSSRNRDVTRICAVLSDAGLSVLAPDLRGHGGSGGACTAGADETRDVAAAVAWLRAAGHDRVAVLGWSMGGTSVLRHAGLGGDADAVVSVSAPGQWWERSTRPMRIVHWTFESRAGRAAVRLAKRTRIAADAWAELPAAPAEVVGAIAPRPLLLVHGEQDTFFPLRHVHELAAAAPTAEVWIEPGMGHAEVATTDELAGRIARWTRHALSARAPVCDDARHE